MFADRQDAGKKLAEALRPYRVAGMIVLALPRGGVPIGYEIAQGLDIPMEVLVVRKLGAPGQEELAMGAIGPEGITVLNEDVIRALNIPQDAIDQVIRREREELERRMSCFRGARPFPELEGRTIILTDDGLATGATAVAGLRTIRTMRPARVILALPVCAADSIHIVRPLTDDLICLETPSDFRAVGHWYRNFYQMTDSEVLDLLNEAPSAYLNSAPPP